MRHVADDTEIRIDQAGQHQGDGDKLADFALVIVNEVVDGLKQGVLDGLLGALRQRVVGLRQRLAAEVIQGDGGVIAAQANGDRLEAARLGDDGDGTPPAGGGLLIDLFDQPALQQLAGDLGDAGGASWLYSAI